MVLLANENTDGHGEFNQGEKHTSIVNSKGLNPFGLACPREEVLAEKGHDWKKLDDKGLMTLLQEERVVAWVIEVCLRITLREVGGRKLHLMLLLHCLGLWTRASIEKNKELMEYLRHYGVIKSEKVAEVMEIIDRGLFVPDRCPPYSDSPMPIGYNGTISAPHMHATCLELLKDHLKSGLRALDVGSGSGYLTACFAMMVGPEGHAVGVEHIPELVAASVENINRSAAASLMEGGSLTVHVADGRFGWPELAPYDAIHVGAAASEIPQALLDQLKPGGRMVIPVGNIFQDLKVVDKNLDGSITMQTDTSVRYVPLTSREAQLQEF